MAAIYIENDPFAANWLRKLIMFGEIADGEVYEGSIEDVTPYELYGFNQVHAFAGIGIWSLAARWAGVGDDEHFWSASCPCQPFSAAGKRSGFADERHLWPAFLHLVEACRPERILGEQVADKDGLRWFDLVSADLEGADYASGTVDLCAAGVEAPHIRQRQYWMAKPKKHQQHRAGDAGSGRRQPADDSGVVDAAGEQAGLPGCARQRRAADSGLAHSSSSTRLEGRDEGEVGDQRAAVERVGGPGGVADTNGRDAGAERQQRGWKHGLQPQGGGDGFWDDLDWVPCRDPKHGIVWRPVEPGTFPLAHGYPSRVGLLRGFGNAINAPLAAVFIKEAWQLF